MYRLRITGLSIKRSIAQRIILTVRNAGWWLVLGGLSLQPSLAQPQQRPVTADPLAQVVHTVALNDQTIFDALSQLSQDTDLAFSIEHVLKPTLKAPSMQSPVFRAEVQNRTVREVLDWLCALDPRYVWSFDSGVVNLFPSVTLNDPEYLMNKKVTDLKLIDVRKADTPVFQALKHLPGKREQLAYLQTGGTTDLPRQWNAEFHDISLRQVLNRSVNQLCKTCGWQLSGSGDFRIVTFHTRLLPNGNAVWRQANSNNLTK